MPVKIRLSRQGRKMRPYYYIVVADSRTPRDGRIIERIGSYDPNSNPAKIDLEFDKALSWLQKGAQPTDTCRTILSYKGVLYKHHLLNGVKKGAFDEATAEERFENWLKDKEAKIEAKKDDLAKNKADGDKKRLDAETLVKEARAQKVAEKNAEEAKVSSEETAEEVVADATPEAVEETAPKVVTEVAPEAKAEEKVEEAAAEVTEPVKEEKAPEVAAKKEAAPEAAKEVKEETAENKDEKKS